MSDGARGLAACEVTLHPPGSGAAGSNEVTMVEVVATIQNAPKSEAGVPAEGRVAMPYVGACSVFLFSFSFFFLQCEMCRRCVRRVLVREVGGRPSLVQCACRGSMQGVETSVAA